MTSNPIILIRRELNMSTVRPEPVEGLCFDGLSTNELANESGRINKLTGQGTLMLAGRSNPATVLQASDLRSRSPAHDVPERPFHFGTVGVERSSFNSAYSQVPLGTGGLSPHFTW